MKKNILVTGSDGFVGKHLVKELTRLGYSVICFDKKDGDIAEMVFNFKEIEHVFHLAALTFVPASWENPSEYYRTNVMGTVRVLEFCRKSDCSLTFLSSYVYGQPEYLPIDEKHPIKPNTPYNHSKLMGEELCSFYHNNFNIEITVLRPFNIYGPGQSKDFLIPTIISQVLDKNNAKITVQNLEPKRDFLYVDDFVTSLIKTINIKGFNIFNIGSGVSYSVKEIIDFVQEITDNKKPIIETNVNRSNEVNNVVADFSLIKNRLNWQPEIEMKNGLIKYIK